MLDGIDQIRSNPAGSTEKIFSNAQSFNFQKSLNDGQDEKTQNLERSPSELQTENIDGIQKIEEASPQLRAELTDTKNHFKTHQQLQHQISMLSMPMPEIDDPENVTAFQASLSTILGTQKFSDALLVQTPATKKNQIDRLEKISSKNLERFCLETKTGLTKQHLADPKIRAAIKFIALQPAQSGLETLALEMAVKNINVSNLNATQAVTDSKKTLAVQKDSDTKGLENFKEKLETSRKQIQKAMKNPVSRWFSAIFKGIAGVVATICTGDLALGIKAIASAHDDTIKAQYDPKNGKGYDYILKKLGNSIFQAKWMKILTTIIGVGSMIAFGILALPRALVSVGKALMKAGEKGFGKFLAREGSENFLKKAGAKFEQFGEKFGALQGKLSQSSKSMGRKMMGSDKTSAEELAQSASEVEQSALSSTAQVSQRLGRVNESSTFSSVSTNLQALKDQMKRVYSAFGKHQSLGSLIQASIMLVEGGSEFGEARAEAFATKDRTDASINMQNQRMRYDRMSLTLSDLNTRILQEQGSAMSQAINVGSQMMKELGEQKTRMASRRI